MHKTIRLLAKEQGKTIASSVRFFLLAAVLSAVCFLEQTWGQESNQNPAINTDQEAISNNLAQETSAALDTKLPNLENASAEIGNLRVGFVNFRRIVSTIPQLAVISKNLNQEFASSQANLLQAQKELEELEKQVNQHSDDEALMQKLIAKQRDVSRQEATLRDSYSLRRNEEVAKLQNLILDEVIALAKERGFDIILNDNAVLYVIEKGDLSKAVIDRFAEKYGSADSEKKP